MQQQGGRGVQAPRGAKKKEKKRGRFRSVLTQDKAAERSNIRWRRRSLFRVDQSGTGQEVPARSVPDFVFIPDFLPAPAWTRLCFQLYAQTMPLDSKVCRKRDRTAPHRTHTNTHTNVHAYTRAHTTNNARAHTQHTPCLFGAPSTLRTCQGPCPPNPSSCLGSCAHTQRVDFGGRYT